MLMRPVWWVLGLITADKNATRIHYLPNPETPPPPPPPAARRSPTMAMATALRKLSSDALRRQPLSRITPLYYMVPLFFLHFFFNFFLFISLPSWEMVLNPFHGLVWVRALSQASLPATEERSGVTVRALSLSLSLDYVFRCSLVSVVCSFVFFLLLFCLCVGCSGRSSWTRRWRRWIPRSPTSSSTRRPANGR